MFGEAPFGLLVAPNWRRNKNDLVLDIKRIFDERGVRQGSKCVVLSSASPQKA
jgi:radical SAM superfamily enzyme